MTIQEQRDLALNKIVALCGPEKTCSYVQVCQALQADYALHSAQAEALVRYLRDDKYIIRVGDRQDEIQLTPRGLALYEEGGFYEEMRRRKERDQLQGAVEDLRDTVAQLAARVEVLENRSPAKVLLAKAGGNSSWGRYSLLVLVLLLLGVLVSWYCYWM